MQAACALAEAAFGAWLDGDDDGAHEFLMRLDHYEYTHGYLAFAHLCAIGSGIRDTAPNGTEQPNWLACAHLIAAAAGTNAERLAHARAAKASAEIAHDAFLHVLACIALALADPDRREALFAEASSRAQAIEAPALHEAVAAIALGRPATGGVLGGFARRFGAHTANEDSGIRIEVLTQRVLRGETPLDIGAKQVALLVALALERRAYARATLAEDLWPDLGETGAREAFNSCLYRVRSKLGPGVVIFENERIASATACRSTSAMSSAGPRSRSVPGLWPHTNASRSNGSHVGCATFPNPPRARGNFSHPP